MLAIAVVAACASGAARADVDLWPLLELTDDSTTVLYPFYVHEGDFRMVFPFYYQTNHGQDHHLLWPLVKFSEGRLTRVAPIWFSNDEDRFTIFPLVWRTPTSTFFLIPPTYLKHDGSLQALLPFYVRSRSDGEDGLWIAWRLFGWQKTPQENEYFGGYLFERQTGPDREMTVLIPLLGWWREHDVRGRMVGLLYWQSESPQKSSITLLPLFHLHREPEVSNLEVLLFARGRAPHRKMDALLPFYFIDREDDVGAGTTRQNLHLLWPLYKREVVTTAAGEELETYRRFAIFSDERKADGSRRFSILGIVVSEQTR